MSARQGLVGGLVGGNVVGGTVVGELVGGVVAGGQVGGNVVVATVGEFVAFTVCLMKTGYPVRGEPIFAPECKGELAEEIFESV